MEKPEEQRSLDLKDVKKHWDEIGERHSAAIKKAEEELNRSVKESGLRWVVLDDDPTGTQTVHDVPVYTDWEEKTLKKALSEPGNMFYILTNSRGLTRAETMKLHRDLMNNLCDAVEKAGADGQYADIQVISRSDSTLRGHYPLETDLIADTWKERTGMRTDTLLLVPYFEAGGRYTVDGIHYVRQKSADGTADLVPAAQTEFAKDQTFGYSHSWLPAYVEEKTGGRVRFDEVRVVSLDLLRCGDVDSVERMLAEAVPMEEGGGPCVVAVDALSLKDLRVFCAALYRRIREGQRFLYRTAADFVRVSGGITDRPILSVEEMLAGQMDDGKIQKAGMSQTAGALQTAIGAGKTGSDGKAAVAGKSGGVIVIGSHTEKTTRQMEALRGLPGLDFIPFHSELVLTGGLEQETERVRRLVDSDIRRGITAVFYTGRKVLEVPGDTKESALRRSAAISDALVGVIGSMQETPSFVIAKGGITSSDVGSKALKVRRAWVLGQAEPGIPVWKCGPESRFPGVPYVIFPGNVGEENTLRKIAEKLLGIRE